jgi:hypothetical protein
VDDAANEVVDDAANEVVDDAANEVVDDAANEVVDEKLEVNDLLDQQSLDKLTKITSLAKELAPVLKPANRRKTPPCDEGDEEYTNKYGKIKCAVKCKDYQIRNLENKCENVVGKKKATLAPIPIPIPVPIPAPEVANRLPYCQPGFIRKPPKTGVCVPKKVIVVKPNLPVLTNDIINDIEDNLENGRDLEINRNPSSQPSLTSVDVNAIQLGGFTPPSESEHIYINANELTGGKGLARIMDSVDSNNPPERGSFEYKQSSLKKGWNVFSPQEIGKYSSKIKNICDCIVSRVGGTVVVSDGIILIYSNYIDGGLIPVALALEEMGFTRFSKTSKSLFKVPPTPQVDVKTMDPRKNKSDLFQPARYSMITGQPRISPDNDFEVKAITNDDNIHGQKIKVVLISKAGAEGIDFKFIRQVHILEPWYNMNRIEQIIGRGVRNFSHKDLPFEKRNVEIFMHGTILGEDVEEAADLYVYRAAEYKAIQIGHVSRLLKENAVDCIINHDQINFTQANMRTNVTQLLSNGEKIDYPVGDAPYSANCDYMKDCNYDCAATTDIEIKVKEDTYNETFIMMNADKILQKIKNLMKERFFYKKKDLLNKIDRPKPYPRVQVYAALTQLIEDSNEFITDQYGRTGYLVNVGDYYLFQPSELNNDKISIFDRSVPVDYKHNTINFNLKAKEDTTQPVIQKMELAVNIKEKMVEEKGMKLIRELEENYILARDTANSAGNKIPKGTKSDDNWYKHCGIAMYTLIKVFKIPPADVLEFLIDHIIDETLYDDKMDLLNYLFTKDFDEGTFEYKLKYCLEKKIIKTVNLTSIILFSGNKRKIMILDGSGRWIPAEPEDELEIAEKISQSLSITNDKYNEIVGFMGYDNKNIYIVLKIKNTIKKRNTGARCEDMSKGDRISNLNATIGENKFTKKNDNEITEEERASGIISTKGMISSEMCCIQEFLLRYYNKVKRDDKIWFLNFEMAMLYKF